MNRTELFKLREPPRIFRREEKPLREEEYPSREEIDSLTGEVGKSRLGEAIGLALVSSGLVGLAVGCAQEIVEPTPTVQPTKETGIPTPTLEIRTPIPTEKPIPPTPTVVERAIGTIPRELGGAESEIFRIFYNGETQQGVLNKFPDGEQWFLLGVYPDLPGVEEKVDFANEVVGYDGEVFLTAVPGPEDHPNARPFYQKEPEEGFPNGVLLYIEDGKIVARVDPLAHLQEGEVSVRFNSEKGVYEILNEEENTTRTVEVFTVPEPTPPPEEETPTPEEQTPTPEPEVSQEYVVLQQITGYSSPGGEEVGYIVPGKTFIILEEEDGWLYIRLEAGGEGWIQASETAYALAGGAAFCPEIPPGFRKPEGPDLANIHSNLIEWEYFRTYQYGLYGQAVDQGKRNADGSISTRIRFNLVGTGLIEAEYILPPGLPIRRIINGENNTMNAPYISPSEVCLEDIVIITSVSSPDVLDPRIPGPHTLDGPLYIFRFRQ